MDRVEKIGRGLGLLGLVLVVAPLCVVLYGVLAVFGGLVKVIVWPTTALLGVVASVLGGGSPSK